MNYYSPVCFDENEKYNMYSFSSSDSDEEQQYANDIQSNHDLGIPVSSYSMYQST